AIAAVMRLLALSLQRNVRALAHQRTLALAGGRLVAATAPDQVYGVALNAAFDLLENDRMTSAALLLPREQDLVVTDARGLDAASLVSMHFNGRAVDHVATSIRVPAHVNGFSTVLLAPVRVRGEVAAVL